jgi:hypothetical protein
MPFDAFQVTEDAEGPKLEVKKESFKDKEGKLSYAVEDVLNKIQRKLDAMRDTMKKKDWTRNEVLNDSEKKLALLDIERKLENGIPDTFRSQYEDVGSNWSKAADLITKNILERTNSYISGTVITELKSTDKLDKLISTVDSESWIGGLSLGEIEDVLKSIGPEISPEEIARIQQAHSPEVYARTFPDRVAKSRVDKTIAETKPDYTTGSRGVGAE